MGDETYVRGGRFGAPKRSVDSPLLRPGTLELGGELTFLVSDSSPKAGEGLGFTDVGLMTLNGRYSFGPVELVAAADLLIKQPSYLDEPVPQAGSLSVLVALGERQALGLSGAMGPLLFDQGRWETGTLALYAKRSVHETLLFKGSLGGNLTHLDLADPTRQALWFSEVVAGLEVVLRTPMPGFAVWTGADLHIPVAKSSDSDGPDQAGGLDPQTCLNFVVAAAYSLVDDWYLYLRLAAIDRGDKDNPQSMLPILNGGFDQQQITLGVIHSWSVGERSADRRSRVGDP